MPTFNEYLSRTGGPLYPIRDFEMPEGGRFNSPGLSIRDHFAAVALHSFSMERVDVDALIRGDRPMHELVAKFCYDLADAMLKERVK